MNEICLCQTCKKLYEKSCSTHVFCVKNCTKCKAIPMFFCNKYIKKDGLTSSLQNDKMVNHPDHYQSKDGLECIEIIKAIVDDKPYNNFIGHCIGTTVKYLFRLGIKEPDESKGQTLKDKMVQDLEKARWYINRAIGELKDEDSSN